MIATMIMVKKTVGKFVVKHWNGIFHPDESRASLRTDTMAKIVKSANYHQKEQLKRIQEKIKIYISMGFSMKEIREMILPEIEQNKDPVSILNDLIASGAITKMALAKPQKSLPPGDNQIV